MRASSPITTRPDSPISSPSNHAPRRSSIFLLAVTFSLSFFLAVGLSQTGTRCNHEKELDYAQVGVKSSEEQVCSSPGHNESLSSAEADDHDAQSCTNNSRGANIADIPNSALLSSDAEKSGGYAYIHDSIDAIPSAKTSLVMSLWVRLLPLTATTASTSEGEVSREEQVSSEVRKKRVIFTTDSSNTTVTCYSDCPTTDDNLENQQCVASIEQNENDENNANIEPYMTLSIQQNIDSTHINETTKESHSSFHVVLEYSMSNPKQKSTQCYRLQSEPLTQNQNKNNPLNMEDWNQIALTVSPDGKNSESIVIYVNGKPVATHIEEHRASISRTSRRKSFQPLSSNVNRTPKTFLGASFPLSSPHGEVDDSLEGYMANMALFNNEIEHSVMEFKSKPTISDEKRELEIVQTLFEEGVSYRGHAVTLPTSGKNIQPSHLFTFDYIEGTSLDSVSKLSEIINNQHGILRRNIDREPFTYLGGNRYSHYRDGSFVRGKITNDVKEEIDNLARRRRTHIRNAMRHAWEGYRIHAWGKDELKPLSKRGHDNWGGMGVTLVDSLSTLWLMDMKDEFWEARDWVKDNWSLDHVGTVSVFETTIRSLGGLLSAYDLSGDKLFLEKADELGTALSHSFGSATGIPFSETIINGDYSFNSDWHVNHAVLSELGTLQLEFRYLAVATGNREYAAMVERIIKQMEKLQPSDGLFPIFVVNDYSATPRIDTKQKITFGAMGDSFYEYLLKVWLQGARKETHYRTMYDKAMDGVHNLLVWQTRAHGLTYLADLESNKVLHKMDHLACFMGGNLALGAYTNPDGLDSPRAQRDLKLGKALAYTCYQMYAKHKSGISPEFVKFNSNLHDFTKPPNAGFYILRPETVESFFVLNQLTGDPVYREWGWEVFKAIEEHCRSDVAYASLKDVNDPGKGTSDRMESFFLAETLKYLYLLQDPDTDIDLEKHVFNTEAHPLKMFRDQ